MKNNTNTNNSSSQINLKSPFGFGKENKNDYNYINKDNSQNFQKYKKNTSSTNFINENYKTQQNFFTNQDKRIKHFKSLDSEGSNNLEKSYLNSTQKYSDTFQNDQQKTVLATLLRGKSSTLNSIDQFQIQCNSGNKISRKKE